MLLTSVRTQLGPRYTEHICPLPASLKRRCFIRFFSSMSAVWKEVMGIDFGTTNCRVAVMERDGNPKMIEISDQEKSMPTVVSFDQNGKTIVGAHPKEPISDETVIGIKRLIGRSYDEDDMELQKLKKMIPYDIIPRRKSEAQIELTNGKKYSPTYIASHIIGRLIDETSKCRGNIYAHAVIAVPPFFDKYRAFALKQAAQKAPKSQITLDLPVDTIDEASAASYYHMRKHGKNGCFAVIDLGGGSFDISVVNASNEKCELKHTKYDDTVAGVDLDHAMMELLLKRLELKTGEKIHKLGLSAHSSVVRREAERAKKKLFSSPERRSTINLDFRSVQRIGDQLEISLEKSEFEDSMKEMISKVDNLCRNFLKEKNIEPKQVDEVILVGGMSVVPGVTKLVTEIFGKTPCNLGNNTVALGAAIKANIEARYS